MELKDNKKQSLQRFGAVILSAGYSSRMKAFKPLLPLDGKSVIVRMIEMLRQAGIESITTVTGYQRERLQPILQTLEVQESYNARFDAGMFTSIQRGLADAKKALPQAEGFFLMPVDCPLISAPVLDALCAAWHPGKFHVPVYEGKKGHPLLVPADLVEEICSYDGPGGLKAITDRRWEQMVRVPVAAEGCLLDMDTPEGYAEIQDFLAAGGRRKPLQELARGRTIVLIRHGETRQHAEKMFIGQYDVPLEETKQQNIVQMAQQLKRELAALQETVLQEGAGVPLPNISRIYTSDLQRAAETARIVNEVCGWKAEMNEEKAFREIALGSWDGKAIREIREQDPQAYERRGADIFSFKIGNRAENFYDLQYRAVKRLRQILEEDSSRLLVIVTHSGVIRALENNLRGLRVEDAWNMLPKCSYRILRLEEK